MVEVSDAAITTPRLVLRQWRADDVRGLTDILSHPDVATWLGHPRPSDVAATIERYSRHWDSRGFGRFAIEDRVTGDLVGRVGLMRQEEWRETPDKVEIGWTIARPLWGEGLATEAALAAMADGFERVGLDLLLSWTQPHNRASRRVMEKCGLELRGETVWKRLEHVWYSLTASAWRARQRR
jgi:RimJ/RimL family protein N-acetyltransferase